jgi:uncharacterized protein (DUF2384 family)
VKGSPGFNNHKTVGNHQMPKSYTIHISSMTYGEKVEVTVVDDESGVKMVIPTGEGLAPIVIAALISDHRERQNGALPGIQHDQQRSQRVDAARRAATRIFCDKNRAEGWLLTPTALTGWRIPLSLASASTEGLNLICAILSDPSLDLWAEGPERLEQVLLARRPEAIGTVEIDDVGVVSTLELIGDPAAGRTAWLLTFPDEKSEVVIEGLGWPYDPEHALLFRLAQYREAIQKTEAFILEARRLAAFSEAVPHEPAG